MGRRGPRRSNLTGTHENAVTLCPERVKRFRILLGLTQAQCGTRVGFPGEYPAQHWCHYERGFYKPDRAFLARMAAVLQVKPSWLLPDCTDPLPPLPERIASRLVTSAIEIPFAPLNHSVEWRTGWENARKYLMTKNGHRINAMRAASHIAWVNEDQRAEYCRGIYAAQQEYTNAEANAYGARGKAREAAKVAAANTAEELSAAYDTGHATGFAEGFAKGQAAGEAAGRLAGYNEGCLGGYETAKAEANATAPIPAPATEINIAENNTNTIDSQ